MERAEVGGGGQGAFGRAPLQRPQVFDAVACRRSYDRLTTDNPGRAGPADIPGVARA